MPHATSAFPNNDPDDSLSETGRRLVESILTLRQTIQNIRDDVAAGIAPSIIMPSDNANDISSGIIMLSLEPSSSEINTSLQPLDDRLEKCIDSLTKFSQWVPPATPPKSPEYSIIDLNDLSGAIAIIERVIAHTTWPAQPPPPTARSFFKQYTWEWDPLWKEFYAKNVPLPEHVVGGEEEEEEEEEEKDHLPIEPDSYIYLSLWHLDEQRQRWVHVDMNLLGTDVTPETAAEYTGTWEDWRFDSRWKEWCIDIRSDEDPEGRYVLYATPWHINGEGQWIYGVMN